MIKSLFYYPHGYVGALRDDGNQDPEESEPWYTLYVYWLTILGRCDARTIVHVPAAFTGPSIQMRSIATRPRNWPSGPVASPLAAVYFQVNGMAACVDLAGARVPDLERYWWQPSIVDKLERNVITPACKLGIPNVYQGSVGHFLGQTEDVLPLLLPPGRKLSDP